MFGLAFLIFLSSFIFLGISLLAKKPKYKKNFFPPVSVISWGWRDGNIIERKIKNFLSLNYPGKFEVIIVDNASKDETHKVCMVYQKKGLLKCYRAKKEYDRKAFGLDEAIKKKAKYGILAMTDPDGICEKNWLKNIVQPFKDKKVGAVIGLTHCGNFDKNLFTKIRAVEDEWSYVISPLGRSFGKDVHLICGANYAVRRKALKSVGFHGKKTLGEDYELAIKLYGKNWDVKVANANVWQEEVENLGQYFRQRLRWQSSGIESFQYYQKKISNIIKKRTVGWLLFASSNILPIFSFLYLVLIFYGLLFSFETFTLGLGAFLITNFAIANGLIKFNKEYLIPYVPLYLFIESFLTVGTQIAVLILKLFGKKITWRSLFNGYYHAGSRIVMK